MHTVIDKYIDGLKTLPTAPTVLIKLISLFQEVDRDIDEIAHLIRQDPSLTAGLLRHANSSRFGPEEPIVDVFDAISWAGFSQVYQAVVAKFASQALRRPKSAAGIDVGQLWRHSAIAGVCSRVLAARNDENECTAFTAGLLHDVGKVVLSLAETDSYSILISKIGANNAWLPQAEERMFGFSHPEIGSRLMYRWGLPEEICEPIRLHHHARWSIPGERICAVVCLSNAMAHASQAAIPGEQYTSDEAIGAMRVLKVTESELNSALANAQLEISSMTEIMGLVAP